MNKPFLTYPGGKNSTGVYQAIINQIPPHEIFISGYAGNCGVLANKRKAAGVNYAVDIDRKVIEGWKKIPGVTAVNDDFITWLPVNLKHYGLIGQPKNGVFIFLDPPYLSAVRSNQKDVYNYTMDSNEDHESLLNMLLKVPFPVMVTHYPCELYDTKLKSWRILDIVGRSRQGMRTERLYMNYPEPTALHDYRYIGSDYREREDYKKMKKNMLAKFKRMTELERNYLLHELKDAGLL